MTFWPIWTLRWRRCRASAYDLLLGRWLRQAGFDRLSHRTGVTLAELVEAKRRGGFDRLASTGWLRQAGFDRLASTGWLRQAQPPSHRAIEPPSHRDAPHEFKASSRSQKSSSGERLRLTTI
ncbi:hypothetical protein [Candidatus Viridilinea mediisalina]|uniref:hypothetical protein n=1 Tax=Candidatus Viridilinea mediisalina TaxID=2024553 RepID=UPI000F595626|nr:hypothetical protein [Candidatus Viridilinea mediisalina]